MKRALAFAPLAVLALLAALFVAFGLRRDPEVRPDALVGKPLPALALAPLDGGPPRPLTAGLEGPVVVNLFASWCTPCEVEHPELTRLQAQGVPIVGVAYKDERAPNDTEDFLARLGDPYRAVLTDPEGRAGIELGISGVPETFVIDGRGVVVAKHAGPLLRADADRLLAEWRDAADR